MPPRSTLIPHPLVPLSCYGTPAPYRLHGVRVRPATCKTGIGAARSRMMPHLVTLAGVIWEDGKPIFGARWLCGNGSKDVVFLASADELGGVCPRCRSVAAGPCVYRFVGSDGALLYVGSTQDRYLRIKQHTKKAPWWASVDEIAYEDHITLAEARASEVAAIRSENPRHNRIGLPSKGVS